MPVPECSPDVFDGSWTTFPWSVRARMRAAAPLPPRSDALCPVTLLGSPPKLARDIRTHPPPDPAPPSCTSCRARFCGPVALRIAWSPRPRPPSGAAPAGTPAHTASADRPASPQACTAFGIPRIAKTARTQSPTRRCFASSTATAPRNAAHRRGSRDAYKSFAKLVPGVFLCSARLRGAASRRGRRLDENRTFNTSHNEGRSGDVDRRPYHGVRVARLLADDRPEVECRSRYLRDRIAELPVFRDLELLPRLSMRPIERARRETLASLAACEAEPPNFRPRIGRPRRALPAHLGSPPHRAPAPRSTAPRQGQG
jgi:hypothetical protein